MMPTLKEIAKAAGVSTSTVSIVLGGKAQTRKISRETVDRVLQTARDMGYQLNVSARRLRSRENRSAYVIAVFWSLDFRTLWMVRFLRGLQEAILESRLDIEVVIHPYENDKLYTSFQALGLCNAAIICNASEKDLDFLENTPLTVPVVLYNRESGRYCTVNVEDRKMGEMAADVFAGLGCRRAVILSSEITFAGMAVRNEGFASRAARHGISVNTVINANTMEGGYHGGLDIANANPLPDCVFCASDSLALGALRAFGKRGIRVPEDIKLISIGNGDREMEEYAYVSLSVVVLPMEAMARECLNLALGILKGTILEPKSVMLPVFFRARESTG